MFFLKEKNNLSSRTYK